MPSRPTLVVVALAVTAAGVLTGCTVAPAASNQTVPVALTHAGPSAAAHVTPQLPQQLPGLGPNTLAQVPSNATQAIVVTGAGINSSDSTVVFYQRTSAGWRVGASWAAHNGLHGWSANHVNDDLRSPIGVFTLTDAGGLLPNPGTRLTYDQSRGFTIGGNGFDGESLAGAFDYVIAINYNRVTGTSPLDTREPMGAARGGGIWLHVDHGGPTHACVSLPAQGMVMLLRELSPSQHPVIVMGDRADLAR